MIQHFCDDSREGYCYEPPVTQYRSTKRPRMVWRACEKHKDYYAGLLIADGHVEEEKLGAKYSGIGG